MRNSLLLCLFTVCALTAYEYRIEPFDNLWNLSKQYYGDGFRWEKIWEHNPYIQNPHLIYPNDIVYIPGVGHVQNGTVIRDDEGNYRGDSFAEAVAGLRATSAENMSQGTDHPTSSFWLRSEAPAAFDFMQHPFFSHRIPTIAQGEESKAGEVLLRRDMGTARHRTIPVRFNNHEDVTEGQYYYLVDTEDTFRHAGLGRGRVVQPVGFGQVVQVGDTPEDTSYVQVEANWEVVSRNSKLAPFSPDASVRLTGDFESVDSVKAGLVTRLRTSPLVHPYEFILVDQGAEGGVSMGDLFSLRDLRSGREDQQKIVAVAVSVQDDTATLFVIHVGAAEPIEDFTFVRFGNIK
ncbi:LysM peptidoglycan-binding domain-containing protein [Chitinivibrio alkaliphilus]|uniref:LysM domain-containing protein n=1 Tax=Chitinivibrio alkaliphilus ACht1 TaxID=1313304 RepID=U7D851_9BACT|nr:LysM peptidoglycan-binding domain-containing protein [Chitinivibrio alkaliphilus]ERP32118.1 hypothetical protein CALK_0840 [Chitinivibrio alkaliphilus ACht1]